MLMDRLLFRRCSVKEQRGFARVLRCVSDISGLTTLLTIKRQPRTPAAENGSNRIARKCPPLSGTLSGVDTRDETRRLWPPNVAYHDFGGSSDGYEPRHTERSVRSFFDVEHGA